MDEMTSRVAVFARARPEDKIEIVRSLRRQGKVVSMTGASRPHARVQRRRCARWKMAGGRLPVSTNAGSPTLCPRSQPPPLAALP